MAERCAERLKNLIRLAGPIGLDRFMAEAVAAYYADREPFGQKGDFITAPEISQMFGELIGLWAVEGWRQMGRPAPFHLVELGPGRGTLMADALRAARLDPAFLAAGRLHLVETSPRLRALQAATLAPHDPRFHDRLESLPEGPILLIANEFFDALPIRQFERRAGRWHERQVTLGPDGEFRLLASPAPAPIEFLLAPGLRDVAEGSVAEIGLAGRALAETLAQRLATAGGLALIIDYGAPESGPGDTLQALRKRKPHPPLADPGSADLTAHVDFAALAQAARAAGAAAFGPVPQGRFLESLGIGLRAEALARAQPARAGEIAAARKRLTAADAMGRLFQVLCLAGPGQTAPAGMAPAEPGT